MGILHGLRNGRELGELITEKVKAMVNLRESTVDQMILDEGKAEETRQAFCDPIPTRPPQNAPPVPQRRQRHARPRVALE